MVGVLVSVHPQGKALALLHDDEEAPEGFKVAGEFPEERIDEAMALFDRLWASEPVRQAFLD